MDIVICGCGCVGVFHVKQWEGKGEREEGEERGREEYGVVCAKRIASV